jgi:probable H4MPT-linked C1 transfer pathway protein
VVQKTLANVIGLDIGGANTKVAFIKTKNGVIDKIKTVVEYFPIWKSPNKLPELISRLSKEASGSAVLDCVAVTMTAELSDAYGTKRDGVNHVIDSVTTAFPGKRVFVLDVNEQLMSVEEVKHDPLKVAAANWVATGWMISQIISNCIIIDVGSTTTSIIPIVKGEIAAGGKTDLEKLVNGELVYTGSLRTNIATIVDSIPIRGAVTKVSSELFAQSGDTHLILGNITEREYTCETADGKGKSRDEAMARLARVVCGDIEILTELEIVQLARYVFNKQIEQVADGLALVYSRIQRLAKSKVAAVVTGLGKEFLAEKAAQRIGIDQIISFDDLVKRKVSLASPAVGVALMAASKVDGRSLEWKQ